jgi:GT2 family glycosyltransferase
MITAAPEGFVLRRVFRPERVARLTSAVARGVWRSAALALRSADRMAAAVSPAAAAERRLSLSVIVLSHNRAEALERTLTALHADPAAAGAEVFVADNASTDGTRDMLRRFPTVRVVAEQGNTGIAAFNRAARMAGGAALLLLDDDAAPAEGALEGALDLLSRRPGLGAVALHPRHPATGRSEWPFGEGVTPRDDWPVMGSGNVVRRSAWERVGGYCEPFFLYRNDADLAMSLLAAGWGVHFDPSLVVHHESPAAARKSRRWFDLATRNWVWMCRRHGRGTSKAVALAMGVLNAHWLAGRDLRAHAAIWRGVLGGCRQPPPVAHALRRDGRALNRLLRLRWSGLRRRPSAPERDDA